MFQKGQSGNPGGRRKMPEEEREKWRALATKARDKLQELIDSGEANPQLIAKIAELAANRAYGMPRQDIDLDANLGGALAVDTMSQEEREKLIADEIARRSRLG